jgi:hypothetical protein
LKAISRSPNLNEIAAAADPASCSTWKSHFLQKRTGAKKKNSNIKPLIITAHALPMKRAQGNFSRFRQRSSQIPMPNATRDGQNKINEMSNSVPSGCLGAPFGAGRNITAATTKYGICKNTHVSANAPFLFRTGGVS